MKLDAFKPGDLVHIRSYDAYIIGFDLQDNFCLVGFLPHQHGSSRFNKSGAQNVMTMASVTPVQRQLLQDFINSTYDGASWEFGDTDATLVTQTPSIVVTPTIVSSSGMTCMSCGNFNNYAETNQPDGSYKCFSCRSGGH